MVEKLGALLAGSPEYLQTHAGGSLAGFLAARGNVYMHENLGSEPPVERSSRKYLGFIPGLGLWWYQQLFRNRRVQLLARGLCATSMIW